MHFSEMPNNHQSAADAVARKTILATLDREAIRLAENIDHMLRSFAEATKGDLMIFVPDQEDDFGDVASEEEIEMNKARMAVHYALARYREVLRPDWRARNKDGVEVVVRSRVAEGIEV
jgi:hypothetical protein